MDRQNGLILAAISLVLCACPGLSLCVFGGLFFTLPVTDPAVDAAAFQWTGALFLLCGLGLSLIPVFIGLLFLIRKPAKPITPVDLDEKLPPAI
jgi:hypothetical protein